MEDLILKANHNDVSSYSNFDKIRQDKITIEARIDFAKKKFTGKVDITFSVLDANETRIVLDSKNLEIFSVKDKNNGNELKWCLYDLNADKEALGTPLVILLEDTSKQNLEISIEFSAGEASDAIQWLSPEQTLRKQYPFMFTQCEAILARTLIPCQDSPSAKVKVVSKLIAENPLRALFSGIETGITNIDNNLTCYEYEQNIPIPTYLIAVACGELEYGKLSERCGVWTEVGLKDKAVWEFQNTEDYLRTAEEYLTPYEWGIYNILVLPFSFPYGGMENPVLTFVTPALLTGDRSMTNVIAHEIAHSWTGNLVTNKDWTNFWMNEGFTMFLERKIIELMYGEDMALLDACVGKGELKYAIELFGCEHSFTSLNPEIENIDPDDAFSVVPYEKGFTFLHYLEALVGKENFRKILQAYIKKYTLKSVSHVQFRETFEETLKSLIGDQAETLLNKVEWDNWIMTKGYPIVDVHYNSKWLDQAHSLAEEFLTRNVKSNAKEIFSNWHTNVKLVFLNYINERIERVDESVYHDLRDTFNLHSGHNSEISYVWYQIALKTKHEDIVEHVKDFLLRNGRMKYLKPVYFAWYHFQKEQALDFFDKNKFLYHQVASRIIGSKFSEWNK